ncbi:DoxX family protein [Chitinophaga qingshengii]|uniref:DoxX family protein n=1 Tax=Chitinophaga qingshengii TaxID=1569794 RepID=A0ABR7TEQ9_9BACT|nr:DoxX family protein [Chitinophaga qingshengii]MBC9928760.1 DoxX family protein [Chitinophaga qingshengii]
MRDKTTEWFLRIALSAGFLSAVADRLGLWSKANSAWGNWDNFLAYTGQLMPWLPGPLLNAAAIIATAAELILGIVLLVNFKTRLIAIASGILLLLFAIAMTFSLGIKAPLNYSVFAASAAAFALSAQKK